MTKRIEWTATVHNIERFRLRVCRPNSYDLRDATEDDLRAAGYVPVSELTELRQRAEQAERLADEFRNGCGMRDRCLARLDEALGLHKLASWDELVEAVVQLKQRAEQAERERDAARAAADEYIRRTDPILDLAEKDADELSGARAELARAKAELGEVRGRYAELEKAAREVVKPFDTVRYIRSCDVSEGAISILISALKHVNDLPLPASPPTSPHRAASELAVSARDNDGLRWEHCLEHEKLCYLRNGQHSTPKATSDDCCSKCGKRTNLVNDGDDGLGPVVCADCHTTRASSDGERTALEEAARAFARVRVKDAHPAVLNTLAGILDHLEQLAHEEKMRALDELELGGQQQRPAPVGLSQEQLRVLQSLEPFGAAKPAPAEQGGEVAGPIEASPLPWTQYFAAPLLIVDASSRVVCECERPGDAAFLVNVVNRYHAEQGGKS